MSIDCSFLKHGSCNGGIPGTGVGRRLPGGDCREEDGRGEVKMGCSLIKRAPQFLRGSFWGYQMPD